MVLSLKTQDLIILRCRSWDIAWWFPWWFNGISTLKTVHILGFFHSLQLLNQRIPKKTRKVICRHVNNLKRSQAEPLMSGPDASDKALPRRLRRHKTKPAAKKPHAALRLAIVAMVRAKQWKLHRGRNRVWTTDTDRTEIANKCHCCSPRWTSLHLEDLTDTFLNTA